MIAEFIRWYRRRLAIKALYEQYRYYNTLKRLSDHFGWGPIKRYGEDRYGKGGHRS